MYGLGQLARFLPQPGPGRDGPEGGGNSAVALDQPEIVYDVVSSFLSLDYRGKCEPCLLCSRVNNSHNKWSKCMEQKINKVQIMKQLFLLHQGNIQIFER
jgi:hypothetical protein